MIWRKISRQWEKSFKLTPMHFKPPILKAFFKESPMLDLLLFFTVSTKFCSPVFLSSHKTTQFSFMCHLGDPNSGSSGMCVCVCWGGGHAASGMPVSVCAAVLGAVCGDWGVWKGSATHLMCAHTPYAHLQKTRAQKHTCACIELHVRFMCLDHNRESVSGRQLEWALCYCVLDLKGALIVKCTLTVLSLLKATDNQPFWILRGRIFLLKVLIAAALIPTLFAGFGIKEKGIRVPCAKFESLTVVRVCKMLRAQMQRNSQAGWNNKKRALMK